MNIYWTYRFIIISRFIIQKLLSRVSLLPIGLLMDLSYLEAEAYWHANWNGHRKNIQQLKKERGHIFIIILFVRVVAKPGADYPFRCFTYGLYTGQRFQTIQFLRAYTYTFRSVSFPSNSPISISLLSRKLWRRLEYIFRFSVLRVPQEWKRSGDPENSERLTRTFHARNSLSQVSRGFSNVSRLKRPSTWPRAILDRLFARLHFPFEAHSLQISGQRLRECNRNSAWNIGILSRVKINYFEFVTSFLNWYFFYYYAEFWESLDSSLNRFEHVCEAKWDNWIKICIMRMPNLSFMKSNWCKIIEMIVFKRILNFYNLNNILFDW